MDIHNYKKRLARTLENIKNSKISANNKKVIFKFHDNCFTEGLSVCKIERYLYDLQRFAGMLKKDLLKSNKDDIKQVVAQIEKKEWSPHSKHTFKVMIRKFYKSIEGPEEKGVYPERIRWLHSNVKYSSLKLPGELITEDDVQKMITSTNNLRDRALVAILFESGCRIGEIGNLKIKDITFDEYGMKINVSGKTGGRRVRLVNSVPYLQAWINIHPENQNPDSYIWIGRDTRELLNYATFAYIPKHMAELAGIKKRIHPHLFRHSRATVLAKHLTEAQMKDYLGWTQSSKMAGVYVHMSGRDTDDAILKLNGVKIDEDKKEELKLKPKPCLRCKTINEATNKFCKLCGLILNQEEADRIISDDLKRKNIDGVMERIVDDPDFRRLLAEKLNGKVYLPHDSQC